MASRAVASSVSASSRNCAGSRRPPRAARSIAGPMSRAAPIPTPGRSSSSARAWSVSSSPRATMTGSDDGSSVSARRARRPERGQAGQARADARELEELDRALVHGSAGQRAARAGDRAMARQAEPPRHAGPRLPGVSDADPRRGHDRRGALRRWARPRAGAATLRSHRSEPGPAGIDAERRADQPGAARQPVGRADARSARPRAAWRSAARSRWRPRRGRSVRDASLDALDRLDAHGPAPPPASRPARSRR